METVTLSWLNPVTGELVELQVPRDVAERIAQGEAMAWRGDDPWRFQLRDHVHGHG